MAITILELAKHRGAKEDADGSMNGAEIERVGLPFMGGCGVCGACIAAYNASPSKSGYLKCTNECIGDDGFETVEEANLHLFFSEDDKEDEDREETEEDWPTNEETGEPWGLGLKRMRW